MSLYPPGCSKDETSIHWLSGSQLNVFVCFAVFDLRTFCSVVCIIILVFFKKRKEIYAVGKHFSYLFFYFTFNLNIFNENKILESV